MNTFCSVITSDYIHFALGMYKTMCQQGDDPNFQILVIDENRELAYELPSKVELHFLSDLSGDEMTNQMASKYLTNDVDAFRWSMKPVFMSFLLNNGFEKVICVDSDLGFHNTFDFLFDALDDYNVLLTPHWRSTDLSSDFTNYLRNFSHGMFNAGFFACNRHAMSALKWWAETCYSVCEMVPSKGLHDDQSHLNLMPVFFEKIRILRHQGCNVASWNQEVCKRTASDGSVLINNKFPIVFIHYTRVTLRDVLIGVDPLLSDFLLEYYKSIVEVKPDFDLMPWVREPHSSTSRIFPFKRAKLNQTIQGAINQLD